MVADVTSSGPAEKAGLKRGDVITAFDGKDVKEMGDLPFMVASTPVGKEVDVTVIREGRDKTFRVKIGQLEELEERRSSEKVPSKLGMVVDENEDGQVVVMAVESNSPAGEAGIREGDTILEMDRKPLKGLKDYNKRLEGYDKGEMILFLIKREGATLFVTLKIWE